MKIKTDNYIQKWIISKLFSDKYYHQIKLYKIILDYLSGRDYENIIKLAPLFKKKNTIVLDIGANMGQYACRLNKILDNGTIYSFEPFMTNYDALVKMKKILKLKHVEPFHFALSDKKGKTKLLIPVVDNSLVVGTQAVLSEYQTDNFENVNYIEEYVETITIDDFVDDHHLTCVEFIKIDTEGAEIPILEGGQETIRQFLPVLSVETHPENKGLDFLYNMGYLPYILINGNLVSYRKEMSGLEVNTILINNTKK